MSIDLYICNYVMSIIHTSPSLSMILMCTVHGCHGSVVRESEFKSEDPGFDPWAGQGEGQFFCPSEVNSYVDLFLLDPPSCVQHAPKICAHVKDPISSCCKRVGLTAGGMET